MCIAIIQLGVIFKMNMQCLEKTIFYKTIYIYIIRILFTFYFLTVHLTLAEFYYLFFISTLINLKIGG